MRELNFVELYPVSGGHNNNGYTFSFIIENALTLAIPGFAIGVLSGTAEGAVSLALLGGIVGASYATAMLFATTIDNYAFSQTPSPSVSK